MPSHTQKNRIPKNRNKKENIPKELVQDKEFQQEEEEEEEEEEEDVIIMTADPWGTGSAGPIHHPFP